MKDEWQSFKAYNDEASAEVLAGRLRIEGVPAMVYRESPIPGIAEYRVMVPGDLAHRAHAVMFAAVTDEAELDDLATGEFSDDSAP
ncbi:MAG: hypothetical protein FJ197_01395 [Gammaproteobacteria bacterium]|nr:hypothetical protein [Gammaproteobacteria bacterium]